MTTFVGEDRRRAAREPRLSHAALVGVAAVAMAAVAVPRRASAEVGAAIDTVTALAAVAVFILCRARWRLFGATGPLWAGAAVLIAGLDAALAPHVDAARLAPAGLLAGLALLVAGGFVPAVDTRLRPLRLVALGALATLLAAPVAGDLAVVVASLAAAAVMVARKDSGWGPLVIVTAAVAAATGGITSRAVLAVGFSASVVCCALELARGYADQRSRLFRSEVDLETAAVDERLRAASRSNQRHDVRNAVVAVEGAALVLESHLDRLSPDDRAALTKVLSSGVERLQRLLHDDPGGGASTVDLARLASDVAAARNGHGHGGPITVEVPPGLIADGSAVRSAEALRILLDNAERRAPGRPVAVEGRRDGDWMVLQVRDRGAPVGRAERRSLAGADMEFLVAGRLMRDQGGDVWVESHPDGGAFSLCLPCASSS